jgi:integrase
MAHRKTDLGQDPAGNYRRYLGWKISGGKRIQHLFRLGKVKKVAEATNFRLEAIWEGVEARWRRLHADGNAGSDGPLWDDVSLAIARAVARGEPTFAVTPPSEVAALNQADLVVAWLARLQADLPVIPLQLDRPDLYLEGVGGIREVIEVKRGMLRQLGEPTSTQTVRQALDAYHDFLGEHYRDRPSRRPMQRTAAILRAHVEDLTLDKLDADRLDLWLAYWCRRPTGKRGRMAPTTCRNALIGLRQFLRWLSRSPQWDWQIPAGYAFRKCKIDRDDQPRPRKSFNLEELGRVWACALPWDRALITLALNCGFSKAEIATLRLDEIVESGKHTFIKRVRRKTGAYGQWILWPETLAALGYLARFRRPGEAFAVVNRAGRRLDQGGPSGNENQVIKNHWDRLCRRLLAEHPAHLRLPFKCLRKTGATMLRKLPIENAAELASMYLAHNEAADAADSLLPAYTSRPWRKLHRALWKLRRKLLPVLNSVEDPFGDPGVLAPTPA